ncbi:hypothetical protein GQR88_18415 [Burkholderia glumae AU6208]|nr:hypothetical protein GQR88_18415 [Burkholderia glumae AU6208]
MADLLHRELVERKPQLRKTEQHDRNERQDHVFRHDRIGVATVDEGVGDGGGDARQVQPEIEALAARRGARRRQPDVPEIEQAWNDRDD